MTARPVGNGAAKSKPRGKPFSKGADPRRGLGNRAKKAFSPSLWLNDFAAMTGEELAAICALYAKELRKGGNEIPFGALVVLRWLMSMADDPDARSVALFFQRIDGNVPQTIDVSWREEAKKNGIDPEELISQFVAAMGNRSGGGGSLEAGFQPAGASSTADGLADDNDA